jgi:hypothetical protein
MSRRHPYCGFGHNRALAISPDTHTTTADCRALLPVDLLPSSAGRPDHEGPCQIPDPRHARLDSLRGPAIYPARPRILCAYWLSHAPLHRLPMAGRSRRATGPAGLGAGIFSYHPGPRSDLEMRRGRSLASEEARERGSRATWSVSAARGRRHAPNSDHQGGQRA